jgi:hypothetical protein
MFIQTTITGRDTTADSILEAIQKTGAIVLVNGSCHNGHFSPSLVGEIPLRGQPVKVRELTITPELIDQHGKPYYDVIALLDLRPRLQFVGLTVRYSTGPYSEYVESFLQANLPHGTAHFYRLTQRHDNQFNGQPD